MGGLAAQGGGGPHPIRHIKISDQPIDVKITDEPIDVKISDQPIDVNILNTIDTDISDRCSRLLGQLCFGGVVIDPRDRNWTLDFVTDKVDVSGSTITTIAPTTPINDLNTDTISSGSSSTHTYTATGNFKLTSIQASASGAMKIEVKAGASGSETTKMVAFTTASNLTAQLEFHEEVQITAGQRIQIVRTNRETEAMDVFSTILGFNS